jgi:hypothetical protein
LDRQSVATGNGVTISHPSDMQQDMVNEDALQRTEEVFGRLV